MCRFPTMWNGRRRSLPSILNIYACALVVAGNPDCAWCVAKSESEANYCRWKNCCIRRCTAEGDTTLSKKIWNGCFPNVHTAPGHCLHLHLCVLAARPCEHSLWCVYCFLAPLSKVVVSDSAVYLDSARGQAISE